MFASAYEKRAEVGEYRLMARVAQVIADAIAAGDVPDYVKLELEGTP